MSLPLAVLSAVFFFAIIFVRPTVVIYIKRLIIPALCILFILCLVLFPETSIKAASDGLSLWVRAVVPSLFPFLVAAELLRSTGIVRVAGTLLEPVMRPLFNLPGCASIALAMGAISGYPLGAKITADLKKDGLLTKTEAERLMAFANNSGPLFITGSVGTVMFGSAKIGSLLYLSHIAACVVVGLLFRFYKQPKKPLKRSKTGGLKKTGIASVSVIAADFGSILGQSVRNSVSAILAVGGFIVLFSVIIEILTLIGVIRIAANIISEILAPLGIDGRIAEGIVSGFIEVTKGSMLISCVANVPPVVKLAAASFVIGWAGISVHCQVISIITNAGIGARPYFLGKLAHGIVSSLFTVIGFNLLGFGNHNIEPVLGQVTLGTLCHSYGLLGILLHILYILSLAMLFLAVIAILAKYLKNKKRSLI